MIEAVMKDIIDTEVQAKNIQAEASKKTADILAKLGKEVESLLETSAEEIKQTTKIQLDSMAVSAEEKAQKQLESETQKINDKITVAEKNLTAAVDYIVSKVIEN